MASITFAAREELTAAYESLRRVEHRLQMMADEQTHSLPDDVEAVERFAFYDKIKGASAGWTRAVAIFDDALMASS